MVIQKFDKKVVLILGAGSTRDNADVSTEFEKPPLDNKFFQITSHFITKSNMSLGKRRELKYEFEFVKAYFEIWHGIDICSDKEDSLEKVTAQIFADVKVNTPSERPAFSVFLAFIKLFLDILGETTNNMQIDNEKKLYQIISSYIKAGTKPENLTIISFNYDIYAEKVLATLARSYFNPDIIVFLIQHGYELDLQISDITRPPAPRKGFFPVILGMRKGGIRILKLHGSLNWYSFYRSENIDITEMFDKNRKLKVSGESDINSTQLKYRDRQGGIFNAIPIIVPPIKNKSDIFHSKILKLWSIAKKALSDADELLIYGYSCPQFDRDSEMLLKKSVQFNKKIKKISVIDPNAEVCDRYIRLFYPKRIFWYQNSANFN